MVEIRFASTLLVALVAPLFVSGNDSVATEQQRYRDKYRSQPCIMYEVRRGDYCYKIASDNGISYQQFLRQNPGIDCTNLHVGQSVCLIPLSPPDWGNIWKGDVNDDDYDNTNENKDEKFQGEKSPSLSCNSYTVKEGDVCFDIAAQNNIPVEKLLEANEHLPDWRGCSKLYISQKVCLD